LRFQSENRIFAALYPKFSKPPVIRSLSAAFLLLLFAFSVMPKKTLHDWFANHRDISFSPDDSQSPSYLVSGYWCHCENLVVEFPFVSDYAAVEIAARLSFPVVHSSPSACFYAAHHFYSELRGPPQCG
jgi:hypothetical protein